MQLRMQVENQRATVIDTNIHECKVPDLTAPQVQLSTPEVLRARSTLKEYKDLDANPDAVPTPDPRIPPDRSAHHPRSTPTDPAGERRSHRPPARSR